MAKQKKYTSNNEYSYTPPQAQEGLEESLSQEIFNVLRLIENEWSIFLFLNFNSKQII